MKVPLLNTNITLYALLNGLNKKPSDVSTYRTTVAM